MTEMALQGESVDAMVGQMTAGTESSAATARPVSSALPPPAATITWAPIASAAARARAISGTLHSPPKA